MKKRFKARKGIKLSLIKLTLIIICLLMSFCYTLIFLTNKLDFNLNNETYIDFLVKDSLGLFKLNELNSTNLLLNTLGIDALNAPSTNKVFHEVTPPEVTNEEPLIYLYNSHQTEGYQSNYLESFNIDNTVLLASLILKEYLTDLNLSTIAEERKITEVLNLYNWSYSKSYNASRIYLEEAKINYPSLQYFFDLHRDSASHDVTTTEINGEAHARLLFVVGQEHDNYEANLNMAIKLNELVKAKDPNLSRGILEKSGKGVNGIYNQDFSPYCMVIEVGGQYNTIEEVNNTLKILADVIYDYIKGEEDGKEKT